MDALAVVTDVVAKLQQQGKDKLRHRLSAIGGDVGHGDPMGSGGCNIHHVVAGGQHPDVADTGAGLKDTGRQRGLIGKDNLCLANPLYNLFRG